MPEDRLAECKRKTPVLRVNTMDYGIPQECYTRYVLPVLQLGFPEEVKLGFPEEVEQTLTTMNVCEILPAS